MKNKENKEMNLATSRRTHLVTKDNASDRRKFLKEGVAAVALGLGYLNFAGLKDALAQARQVGKPLFTGRNLTTFIDYKWSFDKKGFRTLALKAKDDIKGFIRQQFHLTPEQSRGLDTLSPRHLSTIKKAIDEALTKAVTLRVDIEKGAEVLDVIASSGTATTGTGGGPTFGGELGGKIIFDGDGKPVGGEVGAKVTVMKSKSK